MIEKKKIINPIRGTKDYIGNSAISLNHIMNVGQDIASLYGFNPIITPIIEELSVFQRSLGETTDVVTKEMYNFQDKGGDDITLRPENTASVVRAFLSNGLQQHLPCKFFYAGPMFRYERPQKGRLRQFHQIGVETLGASEPQADSDVIACGQHILCQLGLQGRFQLELNSLGDKDSRMQYRSNLLEYFTKYQHDLSDDSKMRLKNNPLRILDSKDEGDRKIVANAPLLQDYLNDTSKAFYDTLRNNLTLLDIPYTENPYLVRGLDYYCHTAFEFTTDELGTQATIMGGGRYDGLVAAMGGQKDTAGVGWAAGIERLMLMISEQQDNNNIVSLVPMGDAANEYCLILSATLRQNHIRTHMSYGGNVKRRMKQADKNNAQYVIIIGDDELSQQLATVKNLKNATQTQISFYNLITYLQKNLV